MLGEDNSAKCVWTEQAGTRLRALGSDEMTAGKGQR